MAKQKINAYSNGWQYFCLMMSARVWGTTTISIQFDDNIGDLYFDGLELTKNGVQTRVYNTNGKMTSKHVAQKRSGTETKISYAYNAYGRVIRSYITDTGGTKHRIDSTVYDSDGTVLGIGYKKGTNDEKHYFFEKNAFGDVIAVYRNSDSVLIGTYEYDLWGNPISVKEAAGGRDTDGILQKNPFRYRCYYYDTETGFYYLNSRYYDPQTKRFISADSITTNTGEDVFGYNLYSYCWNSPLGKADHDGHDPRALTLTLEMSTLLAAFQTVQAVMAGVSVGSVAVTGAAVFVATAATVHNVVMCKKLVDAIVDAVEKNKSEKSSENEKGLNDTKDGDDYLDDESPTKTRVGKQKGNTSRDREKQNKQSRDIANKLGLSKKQKRQLHDQISKQGYNYKEALEEAEEMFGKNKK